MFRFSSALLKSRLSVAVTHGSSRSSTNFSRFFRSSFVVRSALFSKISDASTAASDASDSKKVGEEESAISFTEARKLMHLVNVESLKKSIGMEDKEVIAYDELLEACKLVGVARSSEEAAAFAKVLDEAGVVLLFRDKVHLRPDKVVEMVGRVVVGEAGLWPERGARRAEELKQLKEKKEEIDREAHRQVRCVLWSGLGVAVLQIGCFFRLTFWELSWDVMEPVAFFTTATGILIGYAYFLFTSRDPTYRDFMERLFLSRQRTLFRKHNFDPLKLYHLHNHSSSFPPFFSPSSKPPPL